jgi:hypothetical protein
MDVLMVRYQLEVRLVPEPTLALPGGQPARLGRGGGPVGLKAGGFLGRSRLRLRKPRLSKWTVVNTL